MTIIAVIVTHNRLALLQEAVAAIQHQSLAPQQLMIVNNGSTDGTTEWLATQPSLHVITQENRGASGGFYAGLKAAYEKEADWVWVMDDDTIARVDSLATLVRSIHSMQQSYPESPLGFLVSKAVFTDGHPHWMNLPEVHRVLGALPFNRFDEQGIWLTRSASFVSLLVSRQAIAQCGYPIREFFIWADDIEYTTRITRSGLLGAYVPSSVVVHKTKTNYSSDLFSAQPAEAQKHFFGIRNNLYCRRIWKGEAAFWNAVLKQLLIIPFRILKKRKDHRWLFMAINFKASFAAIFFRPAKPF
jgi:rhamnopyranosyl-N-acetylglucosaminyl-diphospho-decaprenol beta-1,3/1,4-galactofuranosyltransferase